jgi:hypothetical protein
MSKAQEFKEFNYSPFQQVLEVYIPNYTTPLDVQHFQSSTIFTSPKYNSENVQQFSKFTVSKIQLQPILTSARLGFYT